MDVYEEEGGLFFTDSSITSDDLAGASTPEDWDPAIRPLLARPHSLRHGRAREPRRTRQGGSRSGGGGVRRVGRRGGATSDNELCPHFTVIRIG